jgi:uncharacterized protein involved in outer membrane biogenesis
MFGFVFRLVGRMMAFAIKATLFVGALIAVGAGTMYALFDANQYKQIVTQRLVDVTGRAVSIEGAAELHLTLPPRVVLNDIRIRNARWGTRTDMARIRRVEARLNPLRAIAGDSGLTDIRLEGVDIYLETGPGGIGNWELGQVGTAGGTAAVGAVSALEALGLLSPVVPGSSLTLADTSITFRDGTTGRTQSLTLGGTAVEVAGGGSNLLGSGANLLVAGVTDKRDDPCEKDGTLSLR